jgi:hypothetical protein
LIFNENNNIYSSAILPRKTDGITIFPDKPEVLIVGTKSGYSSTAGLAYDNAGTLNTLLFKIITKAELCRFIALKEISQYKKR